MIKQFLDDLNLKSFSYEHFERHHHYQILNGGLLIFLQVQIDLMSHSIDYFATNSLNF